MIEKINITLYNFIFIALIVVQAKILYFLVDYKFFKYDSGECVQIRKYISIVTPLEKISFLKSTVIYDKYLTDKKIDSLIIHYQIMDSMYLNDQIIKYKLK